MFNDLLTAAGNLIGADLAELNREFYGRPTNPDSCAVTVTKAFFNAGLEELTPFYLKGERFRYNKHNAAYCPNWVSAAKKLNQWVADAYQPGDVVLFDWNSNGAANHIGILERINADGSLATIEGNVDGTVKRMVRKPDRTVLGAFRPQYRNSDLLNTADIPDAPDDWAKDAMEWASENVLIIGDESGNLMPRSPVTRQELAVILQRYDKSCDKSHDMKYR